LRYRPYNAANAETARRLPEDATYLDGPRQDGSYRFVIRRSVMFFAGSTQFFGSEEDDELVVLALLELDDEVPLLGAVVVPPLGAVLVPVLGLGLGIGEADGATWFDGVVGDIGGWAGAEVFSFEFSEFSSSSSSSLLDCATTIPSPGAANIIGTNSASTSARAIGTAPGASHRRKRRAWCINLLPFSLPNVSTESDPPLAIELCGPRGERIYVAVNTFRSTAGGNRCIFRARAHTTSGWRSVR
jgi:hypothetical protein